MRYAAPALSFILAKHENTAGFMAEGVYHATGAPGILVATLGPGIANAVNVIANAKQDSVPLIALTGSVDASEAERYTHQVIDHCDLMRPVAKAVFRASANVADAMIDKALAIATTGRPGSVLIDVPISVADSKHDAPKSLIDGSLPHTVPAPDARLDEARRMLAGAQRPVIVVGVDVLSDAAAPDAVRDMVETYNMPLITTYKAKGVLPENHALSLGGHGLSPKSDAIVLPLIQQSDLVICAGYDPIEMRIGWQDAFDADKAIEFSAAPNRHAVHGSRLAWTCGIADALQALSRDIPPRATWPDGEVAATRRALADAFGDHGQWGPAAAMHQIRALAPRHSVVTVDSGAHRILLSQLWPCYAPQTMLQSTGFCTMGCALPLAIGYRHARPDVPVIAFMGDAGFEMVAGELATLRDLALPVIVVVMVDRSLALIDMKQRSRGLDNAGVDFGGTDLVAVAKAFGGNGIAVADKPALQDAMRQALKSDRFTLIAVEIEAGAYDGRF